MPLGRTSKTRFPAVVSVPPPELVPPGTRQRSFCATGSQATRLPPEASGPTDGGAALGVARLAGAALVLFAAAAAAAVATSPPGAFAAAAPRPAGGVLGLANTIPRLSCPGFKL